MSAPGGLPAHLLPLGTSSSFALWRVAGLRTTGLPFAVLSCLADDRLAGAADAVLAGEDGADDTARLDTFERCYDDALRDTTAALRAAARDERFLRAVIWQNPAVGRNWLLSFAHDDAAPPRNKRQRQRELTVLSYLQRYAAKNDTIGDFGPVGWARWVDDVTPLDATYGEDLVERHWVHFECWAMDEVALALSNRGDVGPWVPVRRVPSAHIDGQTAWRGSGGVVHLSALEAAVLTEVDGERTVDELAAAVVAGPAAEPSWNRDAVVTAVGRLARERLVASDLRVPLGPWPEVALADRISALPDGPASASAAALDELVQARDRVAAARNPEQLLGRVEEAHAAFERLSGTAPTRKPGEHYAGRTVMYPEARRAAEVRLGAALREEVAPVLDGLLAGARWFTRQLADEATGIAVRVFDRLARDAAPVPVPRLLGVLVPHVLRDLGGEVEASRAALAARFAEIWEEGDCDGDVVRMDPGEFQRRAREAFAGVSPGWAGARYHSPDLMIAARDVEAVRTGDYRVVVGELHAGLNTLENRVFVTHQRRPGELESALEQDPTPPRIAPLLPKGWPRVTSRTYPPSAMRTSRHTYVAIGDDLGVDDAESLPVAGLWAWRDGSELRVGTVDGAWTAPVVELLGEFLTMAAATRFTVWSDAPRSPRVEVGRIVVARRAWRVEEVPFVSPSLAPARRFLAVRKWAADLGLPRHVFARVRGAEKPICVDFDSPLLVEHLTKALRAAGREGQGWLVTLTEQLPGPDELWLSEAQGRRYTSEFRVVAVDIG